MAGAVTRRTTGGALAVALATVMVLVTAACQPYSGCHGRTLAARSTGGAFTEVPTTPTPICAAVNGVAGSSASDIWVVGSADSERETHLRHWDGSTWSTVPGATIPLPSSGGRRLRTTSLRSASAVGPADVWLVGRAQYADFSRNALIEHGNGTAWTSDPS